MVLNYALGTGNFGGQPTWRADDSMLELDQPVELLLCADLEGAELQEALAARRRRAQVRE